MLIKNETTDAEINRNWIKNISTAKSTWTRAIASQKHNKQIQAEEDDERSTKNAKRFPIRIK